MYRNLIIINIEESKGLIAENLIKEKYFQHVLKNGKILINYGSTNYYILKALDIEVDYENYLAGKVKDGEFQITEASKREKLVLLDKGKVKRVMLREGVEMLSKGDLFIKGGNILFDDATVGVFAISETGGTVGFIAELCTNGIDIISPISISKRALNYPKQFTIDGYDPAIYYLKNTKIYTEIDAFKRSNYNSIFLGMNGIFNNSFLVFELTEEE